MKPSAQIPDNIAPLLNKIVEGLSVLRSDLTSIYLHDSLVTGCFNPAQSDVYTLEKGNYLSTSAVTPRIVTKTRSGKWGLNNVKSKFFPLTDQALSIYTVEKSDTEAWNRSLLETYGQFMTEVKEAWQ